MYKAEILKKNDINHCSNKKEKLLSVKINNICNGNCFFCIDKYGYNAKVIDIDALVEKVLAEKDYQVVSITGGEPFLNFDQVIQALERIRPHKKYIVLNTNGSLLSVDNVCKLNGLIDELRIALHHYKQDINSKIIKTKVNFDNIESSLRFKKFKATFNMVLTKLAKGEEDTFIDNIVDLCYKLHVDNVRMSELKFVDFTSNYQNDKEIYAKNHVKAYNYFKHTQKISYKTSEELITSGCIDIFNYKGIGFHLKRLCGYKLKSDIQTCKVVYSDGRLEDDWIYVKNL